MALDNDALGVLLADTRIDTDAGTDIEVQAFQENITLATAEVAALSPSIALTVGDEAADIRIVTGQLQQGDGTAIAEIVDFHAWLVEDATGILALVAAASIKDGGVGTEVYGEATPNYYGKTDASGNFDLDITDEAGASGKTFWLHVQPVGILGVETRASMAFD